MVGKSVYPRSLQSNNMANLFKESVSTILTGDAESIEAFYRRSDAKEFFSHISRDPGYQVLRVSYLIVILVILGKCSTLNTADT